MAVQNREGCAAPGRDHKAVGHGGGRILGTLAKRLRNSGQRWGVAAICIGVGQGLAVVLENLDTDSTEWPFSAPTTSTQTTEGSVQ